LTFDRASTAVWTTAAAALYAIAPVVWPENVRVNVPPVGAPVMVAVWTSLVTAAYGSNRPVVVFFPRGMPDFSFRSGWYFDASVQ
jgi:hypothetical protein